MPVAIHPSHSTKKSAPSYPAPLSLSPAFATIFADTTVDLTPSIGTEFPASFQLSSLFPLPKPDSTLAESSPSATLIDSAAIVRDLAILVSQRGVLFFRNQDLSSEQQIALVDLMGKETGRPAESGLHVHPLQEGASELGGPSEKQEVFKITAEFNGAVRNRMQHSMKAANIWHTDIPFENHPSDYACLKLNELPRVGGDTLWASAYSAYDRLSPAMQAFLSTLTATHTATTFLETARDSPDPNFAFRSPRGHPSNAGQHLSAVHPVIRTNPVTGWRCLFVNRFFTTRINELSKDESDNLLAYLFDHVTANHDLQVRFRWEKGSVAIWDNRSTQHSATNDYGKKARSGDRVVSCGERPYLDPRSGGRADALGEDEDF